MSISVLMKHLQESSGEQTIGSLLTLNEVFIKIGIDDFPVIFKSLAKEAPDTAAIFSECTSIAIKSGNKDVESDDD